MQWGRLSWSRILSHWISMIWPELKSAPVLGGFWRNLTAMQVNTVAVCQTQVRCLPRLHLFFFWVSLTCVASIIITQNCLWPQKIPFSKAARWVMRRPFGSNVFFFPSQIMCCSLSPVCFEASVCSLFSVCGGKHVWRWTACKLSVFHNTKTVWEVESSCWLWLAVSCCDIHSVWLSWIIALIN